MTENPPQHADSDEPPRDELFRAVTDDPFTLREAVEDQPMPTLVGHLAVYDQWTPINSKIEGRFLERIDPGAFTRTFENSRSKMRVLFNHGQDPQIGDKPLGPIQELRSDDVGAWYEVPLLDTSYNRDLIPGLEAGLYGSSFRFSVMREKFDHKPQRSDHNPEGWAERTILEAKVREFGPVTFPAYEGATAGVRSVTDYVKFRQLVSDPEHLKHLVESLAEEGTSTAHEAAARAETAPAGPSRDQVSLYGAPRPKTRVWALPPQK